MRRLGHLLENCRICPNACGVDRLGGAIGRCRIGAGITVASATLHFGEERELVGRGGSGTIFLAGCSLRCVFCQNADISQSGDGRVLSVEEAGRLMLSLQAAGAENVNLVTPTHQGPLLFEAVQLARERGLGIPVVYNGSGFESADFLRDLDGLVDIYMPDMKYGSDEAGFRYSGVEGYARHSRTALLEMQRQVGILTLDRSGVAVRGVLVRHLVLPGDLAESRFVVDFLADHVSPRTAFNVMAQYHPAHRAREFRELRRRPTPDEVDAVRAYALERGMTNLLA